ncbi:MAG: hypothetical protein AAF614_37190 [Chloroflexota bacterium]
MLPVDKSTGIELRTLIVTAIGLSLATWDIAFWLGAMGVIFYNKMFALWVASIAILLIALVGPKHDRFLNQYGIFALLTPTIWFVVNSRTATLNASGFDELVWVIALAVFVITIPYILYILFQLVESDALELSSAYRNRLILVVATVALMGYLVGTYHPYFVSCEQFTIAGDAVPTNCESWQIQESSS